MIDMQRLNRGYSHCAGVWKTMMILPFLCLANVFAQSGADVHLENSVLQLIWRGGKNGYQLQSLALKDGAGGKNSLRWRHSSERSFTLNISH
ncbi:hypothetical protein KUH03_25500 [Sphingobacterium sp. E70]|uniref:hypothetical protein n=1 Tax=Sphingobacterium sp. E70 TaxID=2853439 RepID=UPI00211C30A7|nr:hypothetical protein [Sphingobacterium sp. E70]ULT22677.1 hypothetical protein KUH03_25500 [Sphingobacterium sp. E70]